METGIYFYTTMDQTTKTVLVVPTSRRLHIVVLHHKRGLVEQTLPLDEERYMKPAMPLKKGLPKFGGVARRRGATKAARKWMAKAREAIA